MCVNVFAGHSETLLVFLKRSHLVSSAEENSSGCIDTWKLRPLQPEATSPSDSFHEKRFPPLVGLDLVPGWHLWGRDVNGRRPPTRSGNQPAGGQLTHIRTGHMTREMMSEMIQNGNLRGVTQQISFK